MLGTYSYHEIFRKTVVSFGTLFNNIEIQRTNEVMKVPLAYGPKQKFLARLDQNPDPTNKRVQMTLPRISFEINGIQYDSSRKVSPTQKIKIAKDSDENKNVFMIDPFKKESVLFHFNHVRREYRSEQLAIMFLLNSFLLCSNDDLENMLFM